MVFYVFYYLEIIQRVEYYTIHTHNTVSPSWFVGRRMCVTLARKSASILFSRQNKLAGYIFAACLSMYCITCRGKSTTTDRLMCIATLSWRGWSMSVSVLACHK